MGKSHPYARRIFGPLVVALFAIGWYRFSEVYITGVDQQLFYQGNLNVYVPLSQVQAYLEANTLLCYLTVYAALMMFWHGLVSFVRDKESQPELKKEVAKVG